MYSPAPVSRQCGLLLSDRLELVVGNDLQDIRMNGTIVGAIVGCLLILLVHALF